ncbi:hypothetical protein V7158_22745, partial [Priestia megaterium]|uniref:hypothetical protein n=1 Tax=Priestia megaterium TaxID=1404 RepID=UPI002FFD84F1
NTVRNKYSHKLEFQIDEKEFTDFISVFNGELRYLYKLDNTPSDTYLLSRMRAAIGTLWFYTK